MHYLGVGFDHKNRTGDLFDSRSDNAFLELSDDQNGTDINQGYILSAEDVTLGITSADSAGFKSITLTPNTTTPGDWEPEQACYTFTTLKGQPAFCGNMLLDVGINEMFIDLLSANRPAVCSIQTTWFRAGWECE